MMSAIWNFKLRRRVFRFRGKYRWIVTDGTQAVHAHGMGETTQSARRAAGLKIIELKSKPKGGVV